MKKTRMMLMASVSAMLMAAAFGTMAVQAEEGAGKELIYSATNDCGPLNPHLTSGSSQLMQSLIYNNLIDCTSGEPKGELAESWEISEDGKEYTFHLRQGVKFSNGADFNAEVAKKNFDAIMDNKEKIQWMGITNRIEGTEVIDEYTLLLKLNESYYPTLQELSYSRPFAFTDPEVFIDGKTINGITEQIGTGPYKLTDYVTDQYAVMEVNENYWGEMPEVTKITRKVIESGQTTALSMEKGDINFIYSETAGALVDQLTLDKWSATGQFQVDTSDAVATILLLTNTASESAISDEAVRLAVWQAIDREMLAMGVLDGVVEPAEQIMSTNKPYCENLNLEVRPYDVEAAKQILEDAGWVMDEGTGIRSKDGKMCSFTLYYAADNVNYKKIAEYLQAGLKEIGIDMQMVGEENSSVTARRVPMEYDVIIDKTWGTPYEPHNTVSIYMPGASYCALAAGFEGKEELENDINAVLSGIDEAARPALYEKVFTTIHDHALGIPLCSSRITAVGPADIENMHFVNDQYKYPFDELK